MAEKDIDERIADALEDDEPETPPEDQDEPDLEDESTDDEDKPEDEPDELGGQEPERVAEPRRSSARDRIQSLTREREAERTRREALERDLELERAKQRGTDAATERAREDQLLASMDEGQRVQYLLAKEVKATQANQQRIEQRLADQDDRSAFNAKMARDPHRARLAGEVEKAVANIRRSGGIVGEGGVTRDMVYFTLLGKSIDEGRAKAGKQQRGAAQRRQAAERVPATRPRSDATGGRRGGGSLADRMERDDPTI